MIKNKRFWAFDPCQSFDLRKEVFENYRIKGRFYEDAQYFYEQMGIAPHPALKSPAPRENVDVTSISFMNIKIDINTLRILVHLLPYSRIVSLKLCSNLLDIENFEFLLTSILSKPNNIYYFSYEWNDKLVINNKIYSRLGLDKTPIKAWNESNDQEQTQQNNFSSNEQSRATDKESNKKKERDGAAQEAIAEKIRNCFAREAELITQWFINSKLEGICLRGNWLGDETMIKIFNILTEPTNNFAVKNLSWYRNNLTSKCVESLANMLLRNRTLEEINLGNNEFTDDDIEKINQSIGRFEMSNEDIDNYNKKSKEKAAILAKNTKSKSTKKPEVDVPFMPEMEQVGDKYYWVKNKKIQVLNFMINKLTAKCFRSIKEMWEANSKLVITIDSHVLKEEDKNYFLNSTLLSERIYFSKN